MFINLSEFLAKPNSLLKYLTTITSLKRKLNSENIPSFAASSHPTLWQNTRWQFKERQTLFKSTKPIRILIPEHSKYSHSVTEITIVISHLEISCTVEFAAVDRKS